MEGIVALAVRLDILVAENAAATLFIGIIVNRIYNITWNCTVEAILVMVAVVVIITMVDRSMRRKGQTRPIKIRLCPMYVGIIIMLYKSKYSSSYHQKLLPYY